MNEADTCRKFVLPKLLAAGWENEPHSIAEQRYFTAGRIIVRSLKAERKKGKRADYLLRYSRDFPIAVVESFGDARHKIEGGKVVAEIAQRFGGFEKLGEAVNKLQTLIYTE